MQVRSEVRLLAERTETGQVFANPDGTFTSEEKPVPVRVRQGGRWVAWYARGGAKLGEVPTDPAVSGAGLEPAVQDADEPVGELLVGCTCV